MTTTSDAAAPAASDPSRVFTVPEVAEVLKISRSLAYNLIARQELPAIRVGRRIIVPAGGHQCAPGRRHRH
jgi:excisionase family DNA binding protein